MQSSFSKLINKLHVLCTYLKIKHPEILLDSCSGLGLRQYYKIVLVGPAQTQLCDAMFVLLGQSYNGFVLEKLLVSACERGISFDCNAMFSAEIYGLFLPQQRMYLELIYSRFDWRIIDKILQMVSQVIANSDFFDFALFLQIDQGSPCLSSNQLVFGTVYFIFTNAWPMNNEKIQIPHSQSGQDLGACLFRFLVSLLARGNLASYKESFSVNFKLFEYFTYFLLIFIDTCCINMSISCLECPFYGLSAFFPFQLISPETNVGDMIA